MELSPLGVGKKPPVTLDENTLSLATGQETSAPVFWVCFLVLWNVTRLLELLELLELLVLWVLVVGVHVFWT